MSDNEKLICGDCKGITTFQTKRGSAFLESVLWATLFFPGFFYAIWRRNMPKKTCNYCGSDFLMPTDSPYTSQLLQPISKK